VVPLTVLSKYLKDHSKSALLIQIALYPSYTQVMHALLVALLDQQRRVSSESISMNTRGLLAASLESLWERINEANAMILPKGEIPACT